MSALTAIIEDVLREHAINGHSANPMGSKPCECSCGAMLDCAGWSVCYAALGHRAHVAAVLAERLGAVETVEWATSGRPGQGILPCPGGPETAREVALEDGSSVLTRSLVYLPPSLLGEWQAVSGE